MLDMLITMTAGWLIGNILMVAVGAACLRLFAAFGELADDYAVY